MYLKKLLTIMKYQVVLCILFSIILTACTMPVTSTPPTSIIPGVLVPTPTPVRLGTTPGVVYGSTTLFVNMSGDDSNSCRDSYLACRTIHGALAKAISGDEIHVGPGTFLADPAGSVYGTMIDKDITIIGSGVDNTFVDGEGVRNVFTSPDPVHVTLRSLTIQNAGNSTLAAVTITDPASSLILDDVVVRDNLGMGVLTDAMVEVRNSQIIRNQGGGIATGAGSNVIQQSLIADNRDTAIRAGGITHISDTTISGNSAEHAPGVDSHGATLIMERTVVYGNRVTSTNPIPSGIIHSQGGSLTIQNVTVSGNPGALGVSVVVDTDVTITFSTFVRNLVGVSILTSGSGMIENNIFAENTNTDCDIGFTTEGYRPLSSNIWQTGLRNCLSSSALSGPILIGDLADNGGYTLTHALMPGSVAIDAATGSCPPGDQRGFARPGGAACDVGAYETGTTAMAITAATPDGTPDIFEIYTNTPPAKPLLTFKLNAFCRIGPGMVYPDAGSFEKGQQTQIDGRNDQDPRWWWVKKLNSNDHCWVSYITGDTSGPVDAVPVQVAPSPPAPTKASQPQSQPQGPACSQINDAKQCINAGCKWSPNNVCISK